MNASSIRKSRGAALAAALIAAALSLPASAGDFNGDGFDDLAIGAPQDVVGGVAAGAVSVVYGAGPGWGLESLLPARVRAPQILHEAALGGGGAAGDWFGHSLSSGDYNSDGFDDLAIGVPNGAGGVGLVVVVYGAAGGLNTGGCPVQFIVNPVPGAGAGDGFGTSLASGDFNLDGFDDLAVGAPYNNAAGLVNSGAAVIIYGAGGCGLAPAGMELLFQSALDPMWASAANENFGMALASGNFDGMGGDDLAIGVPGESIAAASEGEVNVVYGQPGTGVFPLGGPAPQAWNQGNVGGGQEANDFFGMALAAGDFYADGAHDLAIGIPHEDIGANADTGMVAVVYGAVGVGLQNAGPAPQRWHQNSANVPEQNGAADLFGAALATGDFNADLADDLAIGAPGEDRAGAAQTGAFTTLFGSPGGGIVAPAAGLLAPDWLDQNRIGWANVANDNLGTSLAVGDFDADGFDDLASGTPGKDLGAVANAGCAYSVYGHANGLWALAGVAPEQVRRGGGGAVGGPNVPLNGGIGAGDMLGAAATSNR